MQLTLQLPDDLAAQLGGEAVHDELERRTLEAFALEELRAGRITERQLRKIPGLARIELDGFSSPVASIRIAVWKTSRRNARLSRNLDSDPCGW